MTLIVFLIYYAGLAGTYVYLVNRMEEGGGEEWANWAVAILWPVIPVLVFLAAACGTVVSIFVGWYQMIRIIWRGY